MVPRMFSVLNGQKRNVGTDIPEKREKHLQWHLVRKLHGIKRRIMLLLDHEEYGGDSYDGGEART